MALLSKNSYGKSSVRLTKVSRADGVHTVFEYAVDVMLGGEFESVYTEGDNSACIPTDTMKNTVYVLAKEREFQSPESFATALARHFLDTYDHVSWAEIDIAEDPWDRVSIGGKPHPHAFTRAGSGSRWASVRAERRAGLVLQGGLSGMEVIKTTRSGFSGFLKDRFTTLPETDDRIFATKIDATWLYASAEADCTDVYERARQLLLEIFALHDSKSVQQTMYAMGEALLERIPEVSSVSLALPNQHRILANLAPFGLSNANEVFVSTSEPFGLITATVSRDR